MQLAVTVPFTTRDIVYDVLPGQWDVFLLIMLPLRILRRIDLRPHLHPRLLHILLRSSAFVKIMLCSGSCSIYLEASLFFVYTVRQGFCVEYVDAFALLVRLSLESTSLIG